MMMMCCGNVENFLPENLVISLSTLGFFVSTSVVHIFFLCMSGLWRFSTILHSGAKLQSL